jgi:hypothetical protein
MNDNLVLTGRDFSNTPEFPQRKDDINAAISPNANISIYGVRLNGN